MLHRHSWLKLHHATEVEQVCHSIFIRSLLHVVEHSSQAVDSLLYNWRIRTLAAACWFSVRLVDSNTYTHNASPHTRTNFLFPPDTGRLVGTGTNGSMGARLAIARAQHQLREECGVYLHIQSFKVINSVAAASLQSEFDCEGFAQAHSSDAHYDRASFVGLAVSVCIQKTITPHVCYHILVCVLSVAPRKRRHLLRDLRVWKGKVSFLLPHSLCQPVYLTFLSLAQFARVMHGAWNARFLESDAA